MQLGLTEKDAQGPESQQGGHTKEGVDPQSCALLRNLVADQMVVNEGSKHFSSPIPSPTVGQVLSLHQSP